MRTATPPSGPRRGSPLVRSSRGGGGIQKRKVGSTGPVRVDKDGDMDMDTGSLGRVAGKGSVGPRGNTRGRGAMRGTTRATARGSKPGVELLSGVKGQQALLRGMNTSNAALLATLKVTGLNSSKAASNADGGLEALVAFLERKAAGQDSSSNRKIRIKKSYIKGDSVMISATPEDAASIAKLNTFTFATSPLTIELLEGETLPTRSEPPKKEHAQQTLNLKEKFKTLLTARYNIDLKLLDLSNLDKDPVLMELGKGVDHTSKIFPALMAVLDTILEDGFKDWKEKRDAIVSVTLANNNLDNVKSVTVLASTLPSVRNIDLSNNNFPDIRSIQAWRWKFRNLETLVLTNNPIIAQEPDLTVELLKWYPKLMVLNGVPVRSPEQVAALAAANTPIPISVGDFRDTAQVGETFVKAFITLYDNDRAALLQNYYDAESVFSVVVNTSSPRNREHSSPIPPWAAYLKDSRNLAKITNITTRMDRAHRGIDSIKSIWSSFPATKHPDLVNEFNKYMLECRPQPGLVDPTGQSPSGVTGLIITMHGEFIEDNPTFEGVAMRSFSRTFVLGPGATSAQPIRVMSDMMILRAHSPVAQPPQTTAAQPVNDQPQFISPPQQPTIGLSAVQQQQLLITQLCEQTSMNQQYSAMCLEQASWDLSAAYQKYQDTKANGLIPPEAYAQ